MVVLACSALRVEEWATMKVADLRDLDGALPYVVLRGTKTASARRDVPSYGDVTVKAMAMAMERVPRVEGEI